MGHRGRRGRGCNLLIPLWYGFGLLIEAGSTSDETGQEIAGALGSVVLLVTALTLAPLGVFLWRAGGCRSSSVGVSWRSCLSIGPSPSSKRATRPADRVSVLTGSMNEFAYLAQAHRVADRDSDLLALSLKLATVPCGPLYRRHVSPDRELTALLQNVT